MKHDGKRSVSLEDLLRLKRAERPPESYWADFDRQLRAKQLAALVEKRPWWHAVTVGSWMAAFRRHPLPLGAGVALVAGFFVMRDAPRVPTTASPVPVVAIAPVAPAGALATESSPLARVASPAPVAGFVSVAAPMPVEETPAEAAAPISALESAQATFVAAEAESSKSLFGSGASLSLEARSSFLMPTAEPLASSPLLSGSTRLEARAPASRTVVEPLRQITPPADRRGSRILTAMVSMASVENAMRTTERAANRLSEEQLYDQIRRVGAVGAAVNVKF
ncbi:MAG: hypothetical protein RIR76_1974 [Verrucomicrobiota bacterium]|jgi:hypothetical protein|nr:hypothetical protein [Opitutaceae bacterium]